MGGKKLVLAVVCSASLAAGVAALLPWHTVYERFVGSPDPTTNVDWWFDPARGTLCWIGKRSSYRAFDFIVDLDGSHDTGMSSQFSWMGNVGNYTQHMTWTGLGGGGFGNETGTGTSLISETDVYPPWPHIQFTSEYGTLSEWFHPFVTKRTPPTDWVLGVQASDGRRALPIVHPFALSFDRGQTWTNYDPAAYGGPSGDCIEDLPPASTVAAEIDFDPDTLNLESKGRWVTVYIELPAGYDPRDIDPASVRLNDTLAPVLDPKYGFVSGTSGYITDHDGDGMQERMVKFDRAAVIALLPPGTYPIRIAGRLVGGAEFTGLSDSIRVAGSGP